MTKYIFLVNVFLLTGCTVGPDFQQAAAPTVQSYTVQPFPSKTVFSDYAFGEQQVFDSSTRVPKDWWSGLGSPKLDSLIERSLRLNPSLQSARSTLKQSHEIYSARAGSTLYPQLNATVTGQRVQLNGATQGLAISPDIFNLYNTTVGVSYNFDVFGGNRRVLESLASRTIFQNFQLEGAQLTLAANIVTTAVTQAKLASQIRANEESLTAQEGQLVVARHRLRLGQASEDDVLALTAEAEQTRAGIPVLETRHKQMTHLLATLSGEAPGAVLTPSFEMGDFSIPTNLPLVVPSLLVRNRPDIQAAEALMRAANADYGAAVARMYPQLNLSSSIGSLALGPDTLFGTGSLFWQVLGQLTQPIFNAGLPAESRAALAAFDTSASNYQTVVLDALRSVADVLRALENDARTLESQSKANAAATALAKSVERQYSFGTASYLQLLIAQLQAQRTKFELIAAQAQRLTDTVALFQSMGGGRLNNSSVE